MTECVNGWEGVWVSGRGDREKEKGPEVTDPSPDSCLVVLDS